MPVDLYHTTRRYIPEDINLHIPEETSHKLLFSCFLTTHLHLMLKSRVMELYLHSPISINGIVLNWAQGLCFSFDFSCWTIQGNTKETCSRSSRLLKNWMAIRMLFFSYLIYFKRKEENFLLHPVELHIMSIISLILLPQKQTHVPKWMDVKATKPAIRVIIIYPVLHSSHKTNQNIWYPESMEVQSWTWPGEVTSFVSFHLQDKLHSYSPPHYW
jgi:hypothetical protein